MGVTICEMVDCDAPVRCRGLCSAHYRRKQRNGSPHIHKTLRGVPLAERLKAGYTITEDGCWTWFKSKDQCGYGMIGIAPGRCNRAHRVSYELHVGPIPAGMIVRHSCDNPPCVNPAHLSVGTDADNVRDRDSRGRGDGGRVAALLRSRKERCKRGHVYADGNNLAMTQGRRRCRVCCRERYRERMAARKG